MAGVVATAPAQQSAQNDAEWYLGKPVAEIRFVGLDTVDPTELAPITRPYIGQPFTLDRFWELQGKLYATDLFESLESNAVEGDDERATVIIEFLARERPTVALVEVAGNRRIRSQDILAEALVKRGDIFDRTTLTADEIAIRALYLSKGYPDVVVNAEVAVDEERREVTVTFRVVEGTQMTIEDILFVGNEFASESTLRRRMRTKRRSLLDSGAFQESTLQEDINAIQRYYAANGFVDAQVERIEREVRDTETGDRRFMLLTVYVQEGVQYTYGGMSFDGNVIFTDEQLRALVRHRPGTLNRQTVDADFLRIQDLYFENGYIFNVIELVEERDERARTISYAVQIVERDRAHIENIILNGNVKTADFVLMRELPFEVGDVFSKAQILQGLRNLFNTQYFSAVNPDTPAGSAEGLMDIVVNVEEQSTADINFGITFAGTEFPVTGTIRWNERNFLGIGQTIGAGLEVSPIRQSLTFSFLEPWLFGVRWSGGVSFGLQRDIVRNVPQDLLAPVFTDDQFTDGVAVPDPYDGHYVDADTGALISNPTQAQIDDGTAITDWQYAKNNGISVSNQYAMQYDEFDIGLSLTSGYRLATPVGFFGISGGIASSLEFLTYDATAFRPYDQTVRENLDSWVVVNSLSATLSWDQRDFVLNPTNGFLFSQGASLTGGLLFGNRHFIRLNSRAEGFLTLFELPVFTNWDWKMVLAAHSGFSLILPQVWVPAGFANPSITTTDLLLIDGTRVGRGWDPIYDGEALWENKIELRMPIAEQVLWAVGFFDTAVLWADRSQIDTTSIEDVYFSFGAGLRFTIPQFPIRLYFSKRFRVENGAVDLKEGDLDFFGLFNTDFVISLGGDVF